MFYYAVITNQAVATSCETSNTAINDIHYIEITQDQYNNFDSQILNKSWDAHVNAFVDRVYWSANVSQVHDNREVLGLKLKDKLNEMDALIAAPTIKVANDIQVPLTLSYGTMSGSYTGGALQVGATYLVGVNFLNSGNALVERAIYVMTVVQRGLCRVIPLMANANLDVISNNGTIAFSTQHTQATAATVRII